MPLWGVGTNNEKKPIWLNDEEKNRTFADDRGWVYRHPNGDEEILVAIGQLSGVDGSTRLAAPTVDGVEFADAAVTDGDTLMLNVYYNEPVEVTGTPRVPITGITATTMDYVSGSSDPTRGWLVFTVDTTGETGNTVTVAASASISLNGGTITDETDGSTAAELALNNAELTASIA